MRVAACVPAHLASSWAPTLSGPTVTLPAWPPLTREPPPSPTDSVAGSGRFVLTPVMSQHVTGRQRESQHRPLHLTSTWRRLTCDVGDVGVPGDAATGGGGDEAEVRGRAEPTKRATGPFKQEEDSSSDGQQHRCGVDLIAVLTRPRPPRWCLAAAPPVAGLLA